MSCKETPNGVKCPDVAAPCSNGFDLTQSSDKCVIDMLGGEALDIGGADINVFKLLGLHEQGRLVDATGNGVPLSGGSQRQFPASNAFDVYDTEWRSLQKGDGVVASSFLGYNFGEIKLENGRVKYGVPTVVTYNIGTIRIKQSPYPQNRVTRARIERSSDGQKWYGVAVVSLPDDGNLNTVHFKHTVPEGYWRIRPLEFSGGPGDYWGVRAFELIDYEETALDTIQDTVFMENRDRDYAKEAINLKGFYDLIDTQTDLSRFGIELPTQSLYITINFSKCVARLGRPLVIGDVLEIPSEAQYSPTMEPIKKYVEVTDVGWSTEGYTPGWTPTLLRIIAQPMMATQETQDIFGGLNVDRNSPFANPDGTSNVFQDLAQTSQSIRREADIGVPERGDSSSAEVAAFSDEEVAYAREQGLPGLEKIGLNTKALYVEDAMPKNGEPFTTGDDFPQNPKNGAYHRLTYTGYGMDIPPRLFRFSIAKHRWIYQETDRRAQYNKTKPVLQEFLAHPRKLRPSESDK